jgi:hypothetical protein
MTGSCKPDNAVLFQNDPAAGDWTNCTLQQLYSQCRSRRSQHYSVLSTLDANTIVFLPMSFLH